MLRKLRMVCSLGAVLVLLISGAGIRHASAAHQAQAGALTFNVVVGHEIFTEPGAKSSWQADKFYPESITINVGDSINFNHDSGIEPHTASFLGGQKYPDFILPPAGAPTGPPKLEANPLVLFKQGAATYDGTALASSGAMAADIPGPREYSLSFTKPGTYEVLCLVHTAALPDGSVVGMKGKVIVQAAGSAYPMTPAQVDAAAKADMQADEAKAMAAEPEAKKGAMSTSIGPSGETIYHVNVSYQEPTGTNGVLDYMRFSPTDITINQGDKVEWSIPGEHGFHNVMMGDEPDIFTFEPQPAGPPKAFVSTEIFLPNGGTTNTGSGLYSSGALVGSQDPPFGPSVTGYSLAFAQPGRYEYICGLHYHNGMDGHVTVLARTGASVPGMPTTGGRNDWLLSLLVAGSILAMTGLALRRRKLVE